MRRSRWVVPLVILLASSGCHPVSKADHDALAARVDSMGKSIKESGEALDKYLIQSDSVMRWLYQTVRDKHCPPCNPPVLPPAPPPDGGWGT